MEQRNEFGQTIRGNPNNPHLGQLIVDGEEPSPWGTPQKIVPQEEEQHIAFSGNIRPITANQGKRVQLVDGKSGQRQQVGQVKQATQTDDQVETPMQEVAEVHQHAQAPEEGNQPDEQEKH